ncbi:MAG: hypothetical protein R2865_11900 [Deinococcales bacterium]
MLNTLEEINHHQEASFGQLKGQLSRKDGEIFMQFYDFARIKLATPKTFSARYQYFLRILPASA